MCTSHYLDLFITIVIGLNVITMSMEHYQQPKELDEALKICNYIFTLIFVLESVFKLVAFGFRRFFKDKWNQLDLAIVLLSIMGITLEEIEVNASLPINPTIIRIMRVLRIARVLKLLKMAVGMRALLDTVMQALPQVGNLGLLFMLLFFIFAALGVELFGDLICDELHPCEGLGRYATFKNFGMAFLLLFRVSTGDNWNGIMKDTLRDCAHETTTCYNTVVSPIYFVSFVLTAQFVLVNVVIAVLMKHLEESNKEAKEEAEMEAELELESHMMETGDVGSRSPQLLPLGLGMDRSSSGGSPWRSSGGGDQEHDREGPMDSPTADITRDSVNIGEDSPPGLEPPLEPEQLDSGEPLEENLLSVRKPAVGRTHSLPNDSYMFFPLQPLDQSAESTSTQLLEQTHHRQHILGSDRGQSGSSSSVHSQPEGSSHQLTVPTECFRPISPHSLSDSESIPRLPPPRRTHMLSRTLRRQVAVSTDSQEALCPDEGESIEGLVNVASVGLPPSPSSSPSGDHSYHPPQEQPVVCQSQATAVQHSEKHCLVSTLPRPQDESLVDREVSLITCSVGGPNCTGEGSHEAHSGYLSHSLKRYHSVDTQGRSVLLPRPRPQSWLDDPRRHSVEVCSSVESSPQRSTASTSSGFVSRANSLQTSTQLPSPRRKKKISPPCISVDPPDYPCLSVLTGVSLPPPLPGQDTCLRRRAPSSDSKDSFDLATGEGSGQDGGSPNPTNPKLLTLPSFSFEKTSSEH